MCIRERKRRREGVVDVENSHSHSLFPREGTVCSERLVCIWRTHGRHTQGVQYRQLDRTPKWNVDVLLLWFMVHL